MHSPELNEFNLHALMQANMRNVCGAIRKLNAEMPVHEIPTQAAGLITEAFQYANVECTRKYSVKTSMFIVGSIACYFAGNFFDTPGVYICNAAAFGLLVYSGIRIGGIREMSRNLTHQFDDKGKLNDKAEGYRKQYLMAQRRIDEFLWQAGVPKAAPGS